MSFEVVYEFSPCSFHAWIGLAGLVAVPIVLVLVRHGGVPHGLRDLRVFWAVLIGSELFLAFVLKSDVERHFEALQRVENGDLRTVTGGVSEILPVCDRWEGFAIAGTKFLYDDCGVVPGYVQARGGRLKKGTIARVTYFDGSWGVRVITKVEIAE